MKARPLALLILYGTGTQSVIGQSPVVLDVTGSAAEHQLQWTTELGFNYHIYVSTDLLNWTDTGIVEPGCGGVVAYRLAPDPVPTELYYQIHATAGSAFLVRPCQWEDVTLADGVCFAFNLNALSSDPTSIRISKRQYGSIGPLNLIGNITDFHEINNIVFVRGSATWIPDELGEFEILVEAYGPSGLIEATTRYVSVTQNQPPVITIDGFLPSPTADPIDDQPLVFNDVRIARFATTVIDPDLLGHPAFRKADAIRRVEFFDNGVLMGTDFEEPFGDQLRDIEGDPVSISLLRDDEHLITAKAYDSKGGVGVTAEPFIISVQPAGGQFINARPTLEILSPSDNSTVQLTTQLNEFTIFVEVDDDDGIGDLDSIQARHLIEGGDTFFNLSSPLDHVIIDYSDWDHGTHTIEVIVRDMNDTSYPQYLTIFVEDPLFASFATILVDVIANDDDTAAPSTEVFKGLRQSSGVFVNGVASGLDPGMNTGALLTTGRFSLWDDGDDGPNESQEGEDWGRVGDTELENFVAGTITRDAAALEFDVDCMYSQLEFRIQFGSEEYLEYVADNNDDFCKNDAFMVTVDDVVVSFVPDCSEIVAVNSVHPEIPWDLPSFCLAFPDILPAENEHLYISDSLMDARVEAIDPDYQDFQVEYDGATIALRFHALVEPGTHHVRIVIADVDDDRLDSGIFVQAESVRTVNPAP